ncbi:NAC domain-containing protein 78 [Sesamum angolense]|uniref:NAC domain-containing protein 78 n=1 Tax=Sesamum angolense TaxID=2727404 RepID=A0AAE2BPC2_9LAMI|nr:NAC domain-containing protein 78 [Sesamum angolense]
MSSIYMSSNMNTFVNVDAFVREEEQYPSPSRSAMNLPIGYRFLPTDEELIVHYLKRKVYSQPLSYNNIPTVNLYQYTPENLCDVLGGDDEEKEWYLFSPRKRISSGGTRVDRTTPYGYWKASTGDMPIKHNGEVVGYRNTLVYCKCKSPAGTVKKTDWIMHEYRLKDLPKLVDAAENINRVYELLGAAPYDLIVGESVGIDGPWDADFGGGGSTAPAVGGGLGRPQPHARLGLGHNLVPEEAKHR